MRKTESSLRPVESNSRGCQTAASEAAGRRGWDVTAPAPLSKDTYLNCNSEITVCPRVNSIIQSCYVTPQTVPCKLLCILQLIYEAFQPHLQDSKHLIKELMRVFMLYWAPSFCQTSRPPPVWSFSDFCFDTWQTVRGDMVKGT